jgi:hypothetical protein
VYYRQRAIVFACWMTLGKGTVKGTLGLVDSNEQAIYPSSVYEKNAVGGGIARVKQKITRTLMTTVWRCLGGQRRVRRSMGGDFGERVQLAVLPALRAYLLLCRRKSRGLVLLNHVVSCTCTHLNVFFAFHWYRRTAIRSVCWQHAQCEEEIRQRWQHPDGTCNLPYAICTKSVLLVDLYNGIPIA